MSAEAATSPAPVAEKPAAPASATAQSTPAEGAPTPAPAAGVSASLYVGELDPSVTEAMLFEIFNMIGPVASIRVCRDAVTRRSLGYAYVNYLNAADGERALEHLNYSLIKGLACRIMWSQRDPALRKTGQGNIFIKNLDPSIDNKALHDTFAAFGDILSCKVGTDENGKSRGFAFVHYSTAEAAEAAIKAVNGMLLNDKKVYVGHHVGKKERLSKFEELKAQFTNVYLKNIDPELSEEAFEELVKPFGATVSVALSKDESGASKGFGFVNYESHEAAKAAVDALNEKDINGRKLYAGRAQSKAEREAELKRSHEEKRLENEAKSAGVNLYVKNLDDEWDDDRLRAEFESFGTITSSKVMKDDSGASRGFGFVCYSSPDEATKAVSEMNGKMIGTKPLYVALAQRKDVRRQALESQISQRSQQRMQYGGAGFPGGMQGGYMGQPMYGYPPMPGYQPMPGMPPVRGPMMGYPGAPQGMMQARPRFGPNGQPIPAPYGMPPQGPYPAGPGYPVRPGGGRAPGAPNGNGPRNGGPSPVGAPQGLPTGSIPRGGQMPARPHEQAAAPAAQPGRLDAQTLARAPLQEQKQMLGEALYPLIFETQPDLAGKITGMLLEMDNAELLHLVESQPALQEKVDEALRVLAEWGKTDEEKTAAEGTEEAAAKPEEAKKEEETKE
ncbi:polyadenylate-binding protein, cytoplasmic and nuclear [Cryptococcus amylolentus CBS 6039]|uniref:Polyadenylate-binding protein n=1 Tax=Cryptococcus amylolentus CBS 6039 TaxID=1295533 RepID=A0A1E3HDB4_9TREE|nr:polyadenylate-binding protein, cytoplasmic and nuclear [Cryptococcus amylolentus CBS 6039]ODN73441.1 polyadenylate-binding protein, cytoplasmic and nuclear [Cryptococcus amylolentus CBS 6039]